MLTTMASVVIPAHDEGRTIARSLDNLYQGLFDEELEVVVVCNGCTDDTAERAREVAPGATVIELERPGKAEAMRVGNAAATAYPRVHLDADVVLRGSDLRRLLEPLRNGTALAAAPQRLLVTRGSSAPVRWYYDVWQRLPQVGRGLFGRGVVALTAEGQARVDALPPMMGDDLVASEAFTDAERVVVEDAVVHVHAPARLADLVARRERVVTGNSQADAEGARHAGSRTSPGTLLRVVTRHPSLLPKLPVFLAVTYVARRRARRRIESGDFTTWQRDESSRA